MSQQRVHSAIFDLCVVFGFVLIGKQLLFYSQLDQITMVKSMTNQSTPFLFFAMENGIDLIFSFYQLPAGVGWFYPQGMVKKVLFLNQPIIIKWRQRASLNCNIISHFCKLIIFPQIKLHTLHFCEHINYNDGSLWVISVRIFDILHLLLWVYNYPYYED